MTGTGGVMKQGLWVSNFPATPNQTRYMMGEGLSFEKVWAALMENREQMKETDRIVRSLAQQLGGISDTGFQETREQMKETDRIVRSLAQQLGGISDTGFQETREQMKETDRIMQSLAQSSAKTDRKIKKVSRLIGGISNNNGSVAEEYFYNSFDRTKEFAHEHFDFVERNKEKSNGKHRAEFDIVMYNGKTIAIIEVKYKVHLNDVQKVLTKKEMFRSIVSYSKDKVIYLGIAGLSFPLDVETAALEAGIAVIKQVGENMVVQDDRMKKF